MPRMGGAQAFVPLPERAHATDPQNTKGFSGVDYLQTAQSRDRIRCCLREIGRAQVPEGVRAR